MIEAKTGVLSSGPHLCSYLFAKYQSENAHEQAITPTYRRERLRDPRLCIFLCPPRTSSRFDSLCLYGAGISQI